MEDEEIVITGISGRFPDCNHVDELKEKLFNRVDMITEDDRRWPPGYGGTPKKFGKLLDIESFDATFFGVHPKQADNMDPQSRILLEATYEAIIDSGTNPEELRGKKIGVYVGIENIEANDILCYNFESHEPYALSGTSKSLVVNRISYNFDLKGPSVPLDTTCSSSLVALHQVCEAIKRGEIEGGLVGGANLLLNPSTSFQHLKLGLLSPDSRNNIFDDSGNGAVRSESVGVIFIQKAKSARRIYCKVVGTAVNNAGFKENGYLGYSLSSQVSVMKEVYERSGINPATISYLEAHGFGTKQGDSTELEAISEVFCRERRVPLNIGCVKSNLGHSDAASGINGLIKIILAMESRTIPPNLHFRNPNTDSKALTEGRIQVVTEPLPLQGPLVAINSFGKSGTNAHALLEAHKKDNKSIKDLIPRLVTLSGRTRESVEYMLEKVEAKKEDQELITLINTIHKTPIPKHPYRGFSVFHDQETYKEVSELGIEDGVRPVWFIYTGMGCQWHGMGRDLMQIKPFAEIIKRCHNVVAPLGGNLIDTIYMDPEESKEYNINHTVCIPAIQLGITEILLTLGIRPDGIIGHSMGEIPSAYADGCLSLEETILMSFWRESISSNIELPPGKMAAVGLTKEEFLAIKPDNIYLACHNSMDNLTLSGPAEDMTKFMEALKEKGVFVKEVQSNKKAYHSKYMHPLTAAVKKKLEKIIHSPKPRSSKWISSSLSKEERLKGGITYASADYYINNIQCPVYFYEAVQEIPENAVVIEIGPHALLQPILKRVVSQNNISLGLTKKGTPNEVYTLLCQLGKLYNAGVNMDLSAIFPKVEFPVSVGTPMVSPLVIWEHNYKWSCPQWESVISEGLEVIEVDLNKPEYEYLREYCVDEKNIIPVSLCLWLVWTVFFKKNHHDIEKEPVKFNNVVVKREIEAPKDGILKFKVKILENDGNFEVSHGDEIIIEGEITVVDSSLQNDRFEDDNLSVNQEVIYQELEHKGYQYSESFKNILRSNKECTLGELRWKKNWVTFIESHLQFGLLTNQTDFIFPSRFLSITIDPTKIIDHQDIFKVKHCKVSNVISSTPIKIVEMDVSKISKRKNCALFKKVLVPYVSKMPLPLADAMSIFLQIIEENASSNIHLHDCPGNRCILITKLLEASQMIPNITVTYGHSEDPSIKGTSVAVHNTSPSRVNSFTTEFIIFETNINREEVTVRGYNTISMLRSDRKQYSLLRKITEQQNVTVVHMDTSEEKCVESLFKSFDNQPKLPILLISQGKNCLIKHLNPLRLPLNVRLFSILEEKTPRFSTTEPTYSEQIQKGLRVNVLGGGTWCSYKYLKAERTIPASDNNGKVSLNVKNEIASELDVHYISLNTKLSMKHTEDDIADLMKSQYIGFSGTEEESNVMGIFNRSLCHSKLSLALKWKLTKNWSLAHAASVPLDCAMVYYMLVVRGDVKPKQSILINSELDFAITCTAIANELGCTVFIKVDDNQEKNLIESLFPQIPQDNIILKQDLILSMAVENGERRVDLLVNASHKMDFEWNNILALNGVLIQITHGNQWSKEIDVSLMAPNRRIEVVESNNLKELLENEQEVEAMKALVASAIMKGTIRPLATKNAQEKQGEIEFHKYANKTTVKLKSPLSVPELGISSMVCFDPKKTYMIIGSFSTVLVNLISWMVSRGANEVSVVTTEDAIRMTTLRQEKWKKEGVQVDFKPIFSSVQETIQDVLDKCKFLGGVIDLSMVSVKDEKTEVNNLEQVKRLIGQIKETMKKKQLSLDFFVLFSSRNDCEFKNNLEASMVEMEIEKFTEMKNGLSVKTLSVECGETELASLTDENPAKVCLMDQLLTQSSSIIKLSSYTPIPRKLEGPVEDPDNEERFSLTTETRTISEETSKKTDVLGQDGLCSNLSRSMKTVQKELR